MMVLKYHVQKLMHVAIPSMKPSPTHSPKFALKLIKQHKKVAFKIS